MLTLKQQLQVNYEQQSFHLSDSISYRTFTPRNLFALMRQLLPEELAQHRAITVRWRLNAMAAKVVKTGRLLFVKLRAKHQTLLEQVLMALRRVDPPPI